MGHKIQLSNTLDAVSKLSAHNYVSRLQNWGFNLLPILKTQTLIFETSEADVKIVNSDTTDADVNIDAVRRLRPRVEYSV